MAKNGQDSNPGTEASPWLTINHAANSLKAGNTVYVKAGTYNERVIINVSGNAQNGYITFSNYGSDQVILDGTGFDLSNPLGGLVQASGQSYLKIQGFHLRNTQGSNGTGGAMVIRGGAGAAYIEIRNNEITAHNGGNALDCQGSNLNHVTVDNNEIHHCNTGAQEAIRVEKSTYFFKITNNRIHDNTNLAIICLGEAGQPAYGLIQNNTCYNNGNGVSGAHAIYINGGVYTSVLGNVCYNNQGGIAAGGEVAGKVSQHILMRRNLLMTGAEKGITLGASSSTGGGAENCALVHNTLVNNNTGSWSSEIKVNYFQGTNLVKNNIVYDTDTASVYLVDNRKGPVPENIALDYNCYYPANVHYAYKTAEYTSLPTWRTATNQDVHTLTSDPLFQNPGSQNFQLQTASPCKDAGDFLTRTTAGGSGTILRVADVTAFCDGYGGWFPGDVIQVGSQSPANVIAINYANSTLTVDRPLVWGQNDGVSLAYAGSKPDMGAYESGLAISGASASFSQNQTSKTITSETPGVSTEFKGLSLASAFLPTHTPTATVTTTATSVPWVENGKVTVYPNPAKGTVYFAYTLSSEAKITLDIFQISGERVAHITENKNGGAGQTLVTAWRTDGLARGIYLVHLVGTDLQGRRVIDQMKKVALIR
ncbi:MAG: DUF1565 domain-containing protein [Candidatus Firestonebacteria bacterium]|nr:DUF1565 domain-containing protein [Candidatus Firestonebacteria bacterium]